jgi:hypothetical protein
MISKPMRYAFVAVAVLSMLLVAADANAACCGGGGATAFYGGGYSAHYPSTYSSYYAGSYSSYYPSTYQTNYSGGWYPGYYWDRVRARLWGRPSTYVAAYPTTYTAAYPSAYTAAYAPSFSTSHYSPSASYGASYAAPSGCSTCTAGYAPSCSTCTQQVTLRPVCGCPTACGTCETCTSCTTCATGVAQTSYQQPSSTCTTCNASPARETVIIREQAHQQQQPQQHTPDEAPQQTFTSGNDGGAPGLGAGDNPAAQREEQKPVTNGTDDTSTQPGPGSDAEGYDPYDPDKEEGSTYLQPPQLFDPKDRTAQKRHIAPVTTALYQKQASYRNVSSRPITAEQAKQDAIGWESASE